LCKEEIKPAQLLLVCVLVDVLYPRAYFEVKFCPVTRASWAEQHSAADKFSSDRQKPYPRRSCAGVDPNSAASSVEGRVSYLLPERLTLSRARAGAVGNRRSFRSAVEGSQGRRAGPSRLPHELWLLRWFRFASFALCRPV